MKRFLLLIAILISLTSVSAQEKYSVSAKVGSGISMSSPGITPFTIEAMAHYNLTKHWAVGVGSGFGQYDDVSVIPLYTSVKYVINPDAKFNMYVDCSTGYSFALGEYENGGFLCNPEFGIQHVLWGKTFTAGVGYGFQKLERRKSNSDDYVSSEFVEKLNLNTLSLKLGVTF